MKILAVICVVYCCQFWQGTCCINRSHQKPEIAPLSALQKRPMMTDDQGLASGGEELQANMEIHEIDLTEEPDDAIRQVKAAVRRSTRAIIITPFENDELQKQLKRPAKVFLLSI